MIKKYTSNGQKFIHYTYKWNVDSILKEGLRPSTTGQMIIDNNDGAGLYCCLYDDFEAQATVIRFIPLEDFIVAIVFEYTGEYYKCIEEGKNKFVKEGYVVIPAQSSLTPLTAPKNIEVEELLRF